MSLRNELARQALTLSPEDRAYVADLLEGSLPRDEPLEPELAEAWSREIDRRIHAYDRGETTAVDFETALRHMQDALNAYRSVRNTVK